MTVRLDVDRIPEVRRPPEVGALVDEARGLRDRVRQATEALAAAQAKLERAEHDDAVAASQRIRQGATIGAEPATVAKARTAVDAARRAERAATLAADACLVDVGSAIRAQSDRWVADLGDEEAKARDHALDALDKFQAALDDMRNAASAIGWIQGANADGRYDRAARVPILGSVAPTSRTRTANGEALRVDEVVAFARELVAETPAPVVAIVAPVDAA